MPIPGSSENECNLFASKQVNITSNRIYRRPPASSLPLIPPIPPPSAYPGTSRGGSVVHPYTIHEDTSRPYLLFCISTILDKRRGKQREQEDVQVHSRGSDTVISRLGEFPPAVVEPFFTLSGVTLLPIFREQGPRDVR